MDYINSKIYQAFLAAGVDEETAVAAAESIPGAFDFPTKAEFESMRTDFEGLKSNFQELNIRLVRVETTLKIHSWLLGVNLAGVLGILAKLLIGG